MVSPGEGDDVVDLCGDVQLDTPVSHIEGMDNECLTKASYVKDIDNLTMVPSSGLCEYRRGVCLLHNTRGEKYVQVSKNWKDRGGGKGYGFVTTRKVKYKCKVEREVSRSSSNMTNLEWRGQGLVEK